MFGGTSEVTSINTAHAPKDSMMTAARIALIKNIICAPFAGLKHYFYIRINALKIVNRVLIVQNGAYHKFAIFLIEP